MTSEKSKPPMSNTEANEYAKAYRAARKTKEGSPKALFGGNISHKKGKEASDTYNKRIKRLKSYVDDDADISVLEE